MLTLHRYIKSVLLALSFLTCCVSIFSQSHVYKHYGVADGLPSSEVYSAFQDSKGYMWFATDAGVSRFNGYEFENFDVSDGLTDNTVFFITEDHKGRIWFGTFNLKLSYYENGIIYPFKHNKKLEQANFIEKGALQSFVVDSSETVWMGFSNYGLLNCDTLGRIEQIIKTVPGNALDIEIKEKNSDIMFGALINPNELSKNRLFYNENGFLENKLSVKLSNNHGSIVHSMTVTLSHGKNTSRQIVKHRSDYFFQCYDSLFIMRVKDDLLEKRQIEESFLKGIGIYEIKSDGDYLWFSTIDNGVYQCLIEGDSLIVVHHYFTKESISRVFKDNNNGYWFMSLKNGVYYMQSKEISYVPLENEDAILSLAADKVDSNLFISFSKGRVAELKKKANRPYFRTLFNSHEKCHSLLFKANEKALIAGSTDSLNYFYQYKDGVISFLEMKRAGGGGFKSMLDVEGVFYGVGMGVYAKKEKGEVSITSYAIDEEKVWCTSIAQHNGKLWVGTKDGMRIYEDKKITNPFEKDINLSGAITSLAQCGSETLLVGTKTSGVLVVQGDTVCAVLSEEEGLSSNLIKSLHVDRDGVVWAGTNKGLNRINFRPSLAFDIQQIRIKQGLISEEINAISSLGRQIFAGSQSGLIYFDKTKVKRNSVAPPVYITAFNANNEERPLEQKILLTYQENFITIDFEGLNYRSLGGVEYQIRMLGVDTNWRATTNRSIQYPTLQPGNYVFEVKAKNEDGVWSNPVHQGFKIIPPFWLTWWFILLEVLFGLGIVVLIFWYREQQNKVKSDAEKRMVELELKALRSQMNPHFIFNTLNSIQHYIAVSDFKSTNKYIVQFATLIRTILHLSERSVITLQEEIDILTMYMDLEKMRFEEQFDYKIEYSDEVDVDYDEIPSMLLQPYVENAIWHGLMNKKGKGVIKIGISVDGEYLCCAIEDNGIGRLAAAEIKAKRNIEQKSIGMSVTKERLDLISNNEVNVETIDLYDDEGNASGTKMYIRIQYKN